MNELTVHISKTIQAPIEKVFTVIENTLNCVSISGLGYRVKVQWA